MIFEKERWNTDNPMKKDNSFDWGKSAEEYWKKQKGKVIKINKNICIFCGKEREICSCNFQDKMKEYLKKIQFEVKKKEEPTNDSIVNSIIKQFIERSKEGFKSYGKTLDRNDFSSLDWLREAKAESMDFILYLEKLEKQLIIFETIKTLEKGYPNDQSFGDLCRQELNKLK